MSAESPAEVVNEQVRAYNARDVAAFVATYAEDVCIYQMPQAKLLAKGRVALTEHYGSKIFTKLGLRAEVLSRQTIGNKVIDHELTYGLRCRRTTDPSADFRRAGGFGHPHQMAVPVAHL